MALKQRKNYLEDDWNDNALTSRSSPSEGYFLHPSDNLTSSGDYEPGEALKAVYRPEWNVLNGSPSASSGVVQMPGGSSTEDLIVTPSQHSVGQFAVDFSYSTTGDGGCQLNVFSNSKDFLNGSGYYTVVKADGTDYDLWRRDSGTAVEILSSTWAEDSQTHTQKVTRDTYGNFELIFDGTSKGTVTDKNHSKAEFFSLRYGPVSTNVDLTYDNLVVK